MRNGEKLRGFVMGVLVTLLAGMLAVPVLAATAEVTFNALNLKVNGKTVVSAGESLVRPNGLEVPYSIAYKGTTYLPLQTLAEMLNADAQWEASTSSALITLRKDDLYPSTTCASFTQITGTPLDMYIRSVGMDMYGYELITGESDNVLQYLSYLYEVGYTLYETTDTPGATSITYMMTKDLEVIFITCDFAEEVVWVSPVDVSGGNS